jgi:hypothetical protein
MKTLLDTQLSQYFIAHDEMKIKFIAYTTKIFYWPEETKKKKKQKNKSLIY